MIFQNNKAAVPQSSNTKIANSKDHPKKVDKIFLSLNFICQ